MRKLLAVLMVLFGWLAFVGQAVAGASAGYSECCMDGCKGMTQCASATCQTCAAPQPAPLGEALPTAVLADEHLRQSATPFEAGLRRGPWIPPD